MIPPVYTNMLQGSKTFIAQCIRYFYRGAPPVARRADKRSPITIGTGSHACIEIETHCLFSNREGLGTSL